MKYRNISRIRLKYVKCPKCNVTFKSEMSLNSHVCMFKLDSEISFEPKPMSFEPKPVSIELMPVSIEPKPVSLAITHQGPLEEVKVNNHYKCSKCNVTFNSDASINFHMSSNFQCLQYTLSLLNNKKKKNIGRPKNI